VDPVLKKLGFSSRGTSANGMENKMCKHLEDCGFHIREGCVVDPDPENPKLHPKMEKFWKIFNVSRA
jgi:hypothetical protein